MTARLRCLAALVAASALVVPVSAALSAQTAPPGDAMTVTADRIEYNSATRVVRADGHVRAAGRDAVITADRLEANLETQAVIASGNVTLTQGAGGRSFAETQKVVKGSFLSYNLSTGVGHFEQASGQLGSWHVSGETIDLAPQRDVATKASITSCDPDHPLYKVTAKKIEVVPNDHFTAYDASLWVAGVRVVTLPSYTATFGGRSGPSLGYNSLDGAYIEYANSFLVGGWRDEYRIRLATTTGLSAENIISQRFGDHVWSVDLGRSQIYDVNLRLVNLDRYSVDLVYDSEQIPGWPIAVGFEAHAGSYGELARSVTSSRAEAIATIQTDSLVLSSGLYLSGGGRVRYDVYGTGEQRTVVEAQAALTATLGPKASAYLVYSSVGIGGSTPFSFDSYPPSGSLAFGYFHTFGGFLDSVLATATYSFPAMDTTLGLSVSMNITSNIALNVAGYYDAGTQQITEIDYALNIRCDCVTFGLVYRMFLQTPALNNFMLMVNLN